MTSRKRLFLLIASAIGFLILTPIAIFYSLGYRYEPETGKFLKIGMIIAQFEPTNAQIVLDGSLIKKRSPAKIRSLTAKTYSLEIQKQGYRSWKKDIEVQPGFITTTPKIVLFSEQLIQSEPLGQIEGEPLIYQPSADGKKIAYAVKQQDEIQLHLFDTDRNTTKKIYPRSGSEDISLSEVKQMMWSPDGKKILFDFQITRSANATSTSEPSYAIYDENKETIIFLRDLFGFSIENPQWDSQDSTFLYWITAKNLHRFDTERRTLSNALEHDISGYTVANNALYYVAHATASLEQPNDGNSAGAVWKMDSDGSRKGQISEPFTLVGQYEFSISPKGRIGLLKKDGGMLMVVITKDNLQYAEPIGEHVIQIAWDQANTEEDVLVYATEHELNAYRFEKAQRETITRVSQQIRTFTLYPQYEYIVFETDKDIQVIDLTFEGNRNNFAVAPVSNKASNISFADGGVSIVFSDHDAQQRLRYYLIRLK